VTVDGHCAAGSPQFPAALTNSSKLKTQNRKRPQ